MKTTNATASMRKILSAITNRGNYCLILGHQPDVIRCTDNPLVNIPEWSRCKHCSHNMGEV